MTVADEPDDATDLAALVERVPEGWSRVTWAGRSWGVSRVTRADAGVVTIEAEELGGTGRVSANVWRTSGGALLRPCEMPADDVLRFLRGWAPTGMTARQRTAGRRAQ